MQLRPPTRSEPTTRLGTKVAARTIAVAVATVAVLVVLPDATAGAAPPFAGAQEATVRPGAVTTSATGQCSANFVFSNGVDVFIGQAAHCTGTGGPTATNGCDSGSLPLGSPVTVEGATQPGSLAYNSWLTMQATGETDPETCLFNDFALVQLHPADVARTNPSVPAWGGPVGLGTTTSAGEQVFSYASSSLRLGLELLSPKLGFSLGQGGDGRTHSVYTVTPGIPGDSGSGFMNSRGEAFGVLSTLVLLPLPASNGVSDLNLALRYMHDRTALDAVQLVPGDVAFDPSPLNLLSLDSLVAG